MIKIIKSKAGENVLKEAARDFDGYIKVVVDVKQGILAAGGKKHVDGEEVLLKSGSRQEDLWGGGLDLETGEVDFDSMINIRPAQNNPSREVLDQNIRKQVEAVIRSLLK
ncbi:MAG TPA: hypothetical protein DE315_06505 [Candidatus Omnitrophica bacterium]|nr:MAG: hypothetical protein A2Y05_04225 [Omnitrophica WOR_2 bacterium GWA2_53_43]HBO97458.1 hypothetical protein [Candidatus Omnitrophota bacterium]HCI45160.1 hypothetical protein [Candidatus Omnitrophota bacterium]